MKKSIIKYGLITGIAIAVLMFTIGWSNWSVNSSYAAVIGYTIMVAAFSMIFVAISKYREESETGKVSFLKAFLIGLGISVIASIFYSVSWGFFDGFSGGEFIEQYATSTINQLKEDGASAEEIEAAEIQMDSYREAYKNPVSKMLWTSIEIFPVGILVSIISALIFWYKDKEK